MTAGQVGALRPERRPVELVEHDRRWATRAAEESARIAAALSDAVVAVHHVGSTAIAGIRAKPIIDLLPEVTALDALDARADALRALGYEWRGEFGIAGRRYCTLDGVSTGKRAVQLHCFASGHAEIERMLTFRDYLRSHVEEARAYEAEKERCRLLHADDTMAYAEAKNAWIRACDSRAAAFKSRSPGPTHAT